MLPDPSTDSPDQVAGVLDDLRQYLSHTKHREPVFQDTISFFLNHYDALNNPSRKLALRILSQMDSQHSELEDFLLSVRNQSPDLLGYIIAALGACGASASLQFLADTPSERLPSEFVRKAHATALKRLRRRHAPSSTIRFVPICLSPGVKLVLTCVPGLEAAVARESDPVFSPLGISLHQLQPMGGRVEYNLHATTSLDLSSLQHSRTFSDILIEDPQPHPQDPEAFALAFANGPLPGVAASITEGAIRFALRSNGPKCASDSWFAKTSSAIVHALSPDHEAPTWINDPRTEDWILETRECGGNRITALRLNRDRWDFRFSYRKKLIPAASQPTVAAFLSSWMGDLPPQANILDPFCGSGLELVECGIRHHGAVLIGGDLSREAITASTINAAAAGLENLRIEQCDFRNWKLPFLDLIITNPPFGKRAKVDDVTRLLTDFLHKSASLLKPCGLISWVSPQPKRTRRTCEQLGLKIINTNPLNLGGFEVEAQLIVKPSNPPTSPAKHPHSRKPFHSQKR